MSNLAYRQPNVPLVNPPRRWLLSEILGHESYVTSVVFFGEQYDRVVSGSYDEVAKVCVRRFKFGCSQTRFLKIVDSSQRDVHGLNKV